MIAKALDDQSPAPTRSSIAAQRVSANAFDYAIRRLHRIIKNSPSDAGAKRNLETLFAASRQMQKAAGGGAGHNRIAGRSPAKAASRARQQQTKDCSERPMVLRSVQRSRSRKNWADASAASREAATLA